MTNNVQEIHFDTILLDVKAKNVNQVLQKLSEHVSNLIGIPEKNLFDNLTQREEQQNSCIGQGVAVADTKLPRLTRPMVIFSRLRKAINFQAIDGEPVDIVVLVLSPEFEEAKHLQRLATTTRFLCDIDICSSLRDAKNYETIRDIVKKVNTPKQAA